MVRNGDGARGVNGTPESRSCLFSRSIHMLDIRGREKRAVLGGHVRRSRENVIAEKKERERSGERGGPFFLPRARSRIDGKRVRKQFSERSCLASETAFVARRPRHVRAPLLFSLFVLLKKASTRAFTGVIHAVNRRCAARAFCILRHSEHLKIHDSVSKRNENNEKYSLFFLSRTIFTACY